MVKKSKKEICFILYGYQFIYASEENGDWTLMCPNECPGLSDAHGKKGNFTKIWVGRKGRKTIKAQELWFKILSQARDWNYICFIKVCNEKSNQKNLGTIKSSNLYTELLNLLLQMKLLYVI